MLTVLSLVLGLLLYSLFRLVVVLLLLIDNLRIVVTGSSAVFVAEDTVTSDTPYVPPAFEGRTGALSVAQPSCSRINRT